MQTNIIKTTTIGIKILLTFVIISFPFRQTKNEKNRLIIVSTGKLMLGKTNVPILLSPATIAVRKINNPNKIIVLKFVF